ncbi:hypothetical protein TNCV_1155251 [Trichonephila clavipes]|nr:hypothetical protein TNCV_1155251 [Trichonephila clavipes]
MTLECKSRFGKSVNPETVRNVLRKHKHHGRVPQRKPCTTTQTDKLGWHLLKCMEGSQQNIGKMYFLLMKENFTFSDRMATKTFDGNEIQQCMSRIYGLLSNMEGVTKLFGAAWQVLVSGTQILLMV